MRMHLLLPLLLLLQAPRPCLPAAAAEDPRNIRTGHPIPDEGYCDQPYVVLTKEGHWLCLLTTATGSEGAADQHIVSTISSDQGRTWSDLVELESAQDVESAYAIPLVTPAGRVYAFYNYNVENFRCPARSDCVGWYVFRYSDDSGRTWSNRRYRIPMRFTEVDRTNTFDGKTQIFWGIGKPITVGNTMFSALSKCGKYLIDRSEGWFYRSDNILTETDPDKIEWQLLPDGQVGLKNPDYGQVQAEQNIVALADGSIYCMYRTVRGYPCQAISRDGGHTWTRPEFATYTPGGKKMKNPRACPRIWRTTSGKFLFWYHNHSGKTYQGRNPAWIAGGIERAGQIHWSQPEILLYSADANERMSYPDLVEQDGNYWVTETNKEIARVHPIDPALLAGLWNQGQDRAIGKNGLVVDWPTPQATGRHETPIPERLDLAQSGGLALDCWLTLESSSTSQVLVDTTDAAGRGVTLSSTDTGTVRLTLHDGETTATWESDPGRFEPGRPHHVVASADAGPRIITFVIDGVLCDGGAQRQYGWGRWNGTLGDVTGAGQLRIGPAIRQLRLYNRYLRTSEAVAHFTAGPRAAGQGGAKSH
jgi:BNR repeat protein/concanavalin A-like lectin/glucanase superfamily protein